MSSDVTEWGLGRKVESIGAYRVVSELGRGAMSVVYRVERARSSYALKLMAEHSSVETVDNRLNFRREAAALARLEHPSLVRVVEVGEFEGRPYLVMALAPGESLDKTLSDRLLSDGETVDVGIALAGALAEVHRYGLVHRDIKPANVMRSEGGAVTLIDFGMVSDSSDTNDVAGTLHYASPEQLGLLQCQVGATADLYALGATLYECLAGAAPFAGGSKDDLLHRLATVPAPDLRSLRPATRPALAEMIARLLCKDPDDRYQSAAGLLEDLRDIAQLDGAYAAQGSITLRTYADRGLSTVDTPLVGRHDAHGVLTAAWNKARAGRLTFVQVSGEGGSGKTRLVRELTTEARDDGALVLTGKCQEHDRAPFGPLREAADRLVARVLRMPEDRRERAVEMLREAAGDAAPLVKRLSVGLAQLLGDSAEMRALEPSAEQLRFYQALASFFSGLARISPVVLVLDDVQWLDEGSLRVLSFVAKRATGQRLLVVSTCRPTESALTREFEGMASEHTEPRIELGAMTRGEVAGLVAALLGGRLPERRTVDRLFQLTHGNPFAVGEYVRALLERGGMWPTADGWAVDPAALDAVALSEDLVELIVSRTDALDPQTSYLVQMAAVLGGHFSADLLRRAAGVSAAVVQQGLSEMVRAGLIGRTFADGWTFHHDRAREAVVERLEPKTARDIHQALAEALDTLPDRSAAALYSLARHYGRGHVARNAQRVAEANLAAGIAALDEHAYENAYEMLHLARDVSRDAGTFEQISGRLLAGLGRACAMTGRLEEAFEVLGDALERAETEDDRFRLQYLLTLTYASQGRNAEALAALYESFDVIGRPFPRWRIVQAAVLIYTWVFAILLRVTGIGHGRATGEERERRLVLSRLHYAGSMIAMFQGDTFLMVQFVVRDFHNVHFLGSAPETAIASTVYGAVLGTFQLKSVMVRYTSAGVAMAEQLGDRAAVAVCRAYEAVGYKWAGDLDRGNAMLVEALPALNRDVPGSWYAAMMICEQAYSYLHAGRALAALEHVRTHRADLLRTNNLMFRYNTLSVVYAEQMVVGDTQEASRLWATLEPQFNQMSDTTYVRLAKSEALLEVLTDRFEVGPEVDEAIAMYTDLRGEDYYSHAFRVMAGYARMWQFLYGPGEHRVQTRRQLEREIRGLALRAMVPVFRCHVPVWKAALARVDGRYSKAQALLKHADELAAKAHIPRGTYHIALERAELARAMGEPTARFFAQIALQVARSEGWRNKTARVVERFGLDEQAQPRKAKNAVTRSAEQAQRYADALLQVSLASASTLDGDAQAQQALEAVARVLGAERAVFYLLDDQGQPRFTASTGADANSVSRSVVRRVMETRAPVVVTGDGKGEEIGSQSILTHGLRSIMAAPLLLREEMIGVVYLDSRLAKGIFTPEDVRLLLGVCNHIAIAVHTARSARLEAERSAMRRDYELVGAVQTLMLPQARTFLADGISGAGFYRPAAQCGGDWWWHERLPDGSLQIWIGDVSGHGPAPAMITSAVAGTFLTLRSVEPTASPTRILKELHLRVASFGGEFHMTMTVAHFDPADGMLRMWNAGGPAILVQRGRSVRPLAARGTVLGQIGHFEIGQAETAMRTGDRVLLYTDGLPEAVRPTGRQIGPRGVAGLLENSAQVPIVDTVEHLARALDSLIEGQEQEDDVTFVVAEVRARGVAPLTLRTPMGDQ